MLPGIPESDWKVFRQLREVALERFCERVLGEVGGIASNAALSSHRRYLDIFQLIDRRDDELARSFNGSSRSKAISQLAAIHSHALLTEEEMARFTPATRERVKLLSKSPLTPRGRKRA